MSSNRIRTLLTAITVTFVCGAPAVAQASYTSGGDRADNVQADKLYQRAEAIFAEPSRSQEAAQLLVRSASFRPADDPRVAPTLSLAGKLFFYAGNNGMARTMMERAAQHALASGNIGAAAQSTVDAAYIALKQNRPDVAQSLVLQVKRLAASPHLKQSERSAILQRIDPAKLAVLDSIR